MLFISVFSFLRLFIYCRHFSAICFFFFFAELISGAKIITFLPAII